MLHETSGAMSGATVSTEAALTDPAIAMLREQLFAIGLGTAFVFLGLVSCTLSMLRRKGIARVFLWIGVWSSIYGVRMLLYCPAVTEALPASIRAGTPYVIRLVDYTLLIVGTATSALLTLGWLRRLLMTVSMLAAVIAVVGYSVFLTPHRSDYLFGIANSWLAAVVLGVLVAVVLSPRLYRTSLVLTDRGILRVGCVVFFVAALAENVGVLLHHSLPRSVGDVGFATYLLSLGLYAMQVGLANQHRLTAIESELEIARHIQSSILPTTVPSLTNVEIAVAYQPMTAVAGDFYDFIPVDEHRAGFFVADVCGHGVPAALVASMLKMALQSVAPHADNPTEILRRMNRALFSALPGTLVSAAYLWLDLQAHSARYGAAGHPPMLVWRNGHLDPVESNGLLFGVMPDAEYPVYEFAIARGERILLYTDGLTDAENAAGEAFGEHQLAKEVTSAFKVQASELPTRLLDSLSRWNHISQGQQDDITAMVIDIAAQTGVSAGPGMPDRAAALN